MSKQIFSCMWAQSGFANTSCTSCQGHKTWRAWLLRTRRKLKLNEMRQGRMVAKGNLQGSLTFS